MTSPPRQLDGADVVLWAWSEPAPFFRMQVLGEEASIPIHGLAVCRYADSETVYRFSCSAGWEVENDSPWDSVEAARHGPSAQFDIRTVSWRPGP